MNFANKVSAMNDELPYNIEAEKSVITCLLRDNSFYFKDNIKPDYFFNSELRLIFQAIDYLINKQKVADSSSVFNIINEKNIKLKNISEILKELTSKVIIEDNYLNTVKILKDTFILRQIHIASTKIKDITHNEKNVLSAITKASELLRTIKIDEKDESCADGLDDEYNLILDGMKKGNPSKKIFSTNFYNMDIAFKGGIRESDYIVIGANSSGGKSIMGFQLAWQLARQNYHVVCFSTEMDKHMVNIRSRALLGQLDIGSLMINDKNLKLDSLKFSQELMKKHLDNNLFIDYTQNLSVQRLKAKLSQHIIKHGKPDVIMIDYLQYLTYDGKAGTGSRTDTVQCITKELKNLSRDLGVAVIALSQLNMDAAKSDEPELFNLAECPSQIWRDADIIGLMHCEQVYANGTEKIKFNIKKGRNIGTSEIYFTLYKNKMTFIESGNCITTFYKNNIQANLDNNAEELVAKILGDDYEKEQHPFK